LEEGTILDDEAYQRGSANASWSFI
jgi:hypothetical protein